jgi:DNA-binding NtrC family response regulator
MTTHKTKLLLVDDDAALRHLLSVILTHSGYDVRSAQDGFSALAEIRAEVPDILLSDLYMPGMSGFELLSVVRRRFPMIPVIAMSSAYSGPGVPAGVAADAFYEKATDLDALLGIVNGLHYLSDGSSSSSRSTVAPIWVESKADGSEGKCIMLTCPECMRTFSQLRAESAVIFHEAKCLYCATPISYALVRSYNPASPERLLTGGTQARMSPAVC